jgi:hypothetical protein
MLFVLSKGVLPMKKGTLTLLACVLLSATSPNLAEIISIADPAHQIANTPPKAVLRPTQGISMAIVEKKFGQPEQQITSVGQPPITRWIYKDFVVFFEYNLVIHSVVSHKR